MTDGIKFGVVHPDGTVTDERVIPKAQIKACPHLIMLPEHYRANGICRCNDPGHSVMREWGYRWDIDSKEWV